MLESEKALIFQIQKFSTEDGPGIRTTVFFKQCPLKCIWCHNPESILKEAQLEWFKHKCIGCKTCVETCQQNILSFNEEGIVINRENCLGCGNCAEECPSGALNLLGKKWTLSDLFYEIRKDKIYYVESEGGITVSGGEPTLQPKFILNFLMKCKEDGISTALDTCGYANPEIYQRLLPYIDLVLFDIKEIDSNKHKEYTGVPNDKIMENAVWISEFLKQNGKKMWIRTPVIPKYTATAENIKGIGEFIVNKLNNFPERWDLLSFNRLCADKYSRLSIDWILKDEPLMTKEQMNYFLEIAKTTGVKNVKWSGLTRKSDVMVDNVGNSKDDISKSSN